MDFDELQKSWKAQPVEIPELKPEMIDELASKWAKQQSKLKRVNIFVSVAFLLVFVDLAWVYFSFHKGHTIFFGGSIFMMFLMMCIYLVMLWRGLSLDKFTTDTASNIYLDKYIRKLRWQRMLITRYSWIYAFLLWLLFMFYCYDITLNATLQMKLIIPSVITVYIFGMQLIMRFTKKKKQLKNIDDLIAEMTDMKRKMETL